MQKETLVENGKFISTAMRLKMEGRLEGLEKGLKKVAFNLIQKGLDNDFIRQTTELSDEQINYLRTLDLSVFELETSFNQK